MAISANVPLSTIIIVACVCAVVIITLVSVLIWLCVRRRNINRAKSAGKGPQPQQQQLENLPQISSKGSYKAGHLAGKGPNGGIQNASIHTNGGLHHHPAVAFVSPTCAAGNRTSETCFDSCDGEGRGGDIGCMSPHDPSSPQMGAVHLFPRAFYESDATDNSGSPPTPNKQLHRKVIYEVVV